MPGSTPDPSPISDLEFHTTHRFTLRGKRGSVRTLIAYQGGDRAFFMYGFAKNVRRNIDTDELAALKLMAKTLLEKSDVRLKKDLETKILIEVCNDG